MGIHHSTRGHRFGSAWRLTLAQTLAQHKTNRLAYIILEFLWNPQDRFFSIRRNSSSTSLVKEYAIICAILCSYFCEAMVRVRITTATWWTVCESFRPAPNALLTSGGLDVSLRCTTDLWWTWCQFTMHYWPLVDLMSVYDALLTSGGLDVSLRCTTDLWRIDYEVHQRSVVHRKLTSTGPRRTKLDKARLFLAYVVASAGACSQWGLRPLKLNIALVTDPCSSCTNQLTGIHLSQSYLPWVVTQVFIW